MDVLIPLVLFILVLSFLVIIHELGHYLSAKFFKVHVEEFGLGYPPRAKKLFQIGSTLFSLNWIPFGGFVKMEGEDGPVAEPAPSKKYGADAPFYTKSRFARLVIILAGAGVNFIFGMIALSIYFSVRGIPSVVPAPRIAEIAPDSPAAQSHVPTDVNITGFQIKDQLVSTATSEDVISVVTQHMGEHVTMITTGKCQELDCDPTPQKFEVYIRRKNELPANQGSLGIQMASIVTAEFYPWPEMPVRAAVYGVKQAFLLSYLILQGLGQIIQNASHGQVPAEISGPVGIYTQANNAGFFSHGLLELLNLAGILSINLAVMNVLPFPALDGGRVLFILLEAIVGKKRVQKVEGYANYFGFALLIFLIVIITIKDVGHYF
jgi:regulator of sigma E protease